MRVRVGVRASQYLIVPELETPLRYLANLFPDKPLRDEHRVRIRGTWVHASSLHASPSQYMSAGNISWRKRTSQGSTGDRRKGVLLASPSAYTLSRAVGVRGFILASASTYTV